MWHGEADGTMLLRSEKKWWKHNSYGGFTNNNGVSTNGFRVKSRWCSANDAPETWEDHRRSDVQDPEIPWPICHVRLRNWVYRHAPDITPKMTPMGMEATCTRNWVGNSSTHDWITQALIVFKRPLPLHLYRYHLVGGAAQCGTRVQSPERERSDPTSFSSAKKFSQLHGGHLNILNWWKT